MFIGHLGIGLALKKAEPRLNLGWLFAAAMLPDVVLWILVLAGVEQSRVPPDYAQRRYLGFEFPYSHSLLGTVIASALAGGIGWWLIRRWRAAGVLAAAVLSHWLLDVLVHPPEIRLMPSGSAWLGLGLWNHLHVALAVEAMLLAAGWRLYLRATSATSPFGRYGLTIFLVLLAAFALGGQLWAPPPASVWHLAVGSLVTLMIVFLAAGWLDRWRRPV
ncbi:MAG TPA: hypothetical protein VLW52_10130 [Opitutaceae bacterium]|nr:hypothetical protein [Opitutaceae bacterium]